MNPMRPRTVPFVFFWLAALLSNTASGAFSTVTLWLISADHIPTWPLIIGQGAGSIGYFLGLSLARILSRHLTAQHIVTVTSLIEALSCVPALFIATRLAPDQSIYINQAIALSTATAAFAMASGIGGPAWMTIVADWDESGEAKRIHLDSVQFNLGRTFGPMAGSFLLTNLGLALLLSSVFNILTFIIIGALAHTRTTEQRANRNSGAPPNPTLNSYSRKQVIYLLITLFVAAAVTDGARSYLAKWLHTSFTDPTFYGITLTSISLSSALGALFAAKYSHSTWTLLKCGILAMGAGISTWLLAPTPQIAYWIIGGALVGISSSLIYGPITVILFTGRSSSSKQQIAGVQFGIRSLGGLLGVGLFTSLSPNMGLPTTLCLLVLIFMSTIPLLKH